MAVGTDGSYHSCRILSLFCQEHERGVFGVLQFGISMTDVTIERERRKGMALRIDAGGMRAGASGLELLRVPMRIIRGEELAVFVVGRRGPGDGKKFQLAVALSLLEVTQMLVPAEQQLDLSCELL